MSAQTTTQILRCLTLGRYAATVEGTPSELKIRGPQPLAGPLPASIKARRDELVAFLSEQCGGTWPPAPDSRESVRAEQLAQLHRGRREERAREFLAQLRKRRERAA
jgi:hypothetical protein